MRANDLKPSVSRAKSAVVSILILPVASFVVLAGLQMMLPSARADVVDPLANGPAEPLTFTKNHPGLARRLQRWPYKFGSQCGSRSATALADDVRPALYQPNNQSPGDRDAMGLTPFCPTTLAQATTATKKVSDPFSAETPFADDQNKSADANTGPIEAAKDPCAAVPNKPLNELGINISQPVGKLPTDLATACWEQINQNAGGCPGRQCWPMFCYQWDATCFCHQPLYFEEINLERYGYQCDCCLQPAASAFHFFGTIPVLPYCMVAECPGDCVYTLGHYRPGDCNPWRWHWPSCDPLAAAAYGGFWVGMIAAFP